jgi:lipopolysaccharide transport system permease protein
MTSPKQRGSRKGSRKGSYEPGSEHRYGSEHRFYRPESEMRHPVRLIRAMGQDLLASRELAWQLFIRDINTQYRQSLLGIFWAFVPPIVTAVGLTLAKNANAINIGDTDIPYPAYVMLSMTLWQTFAEAVSGPMQAVALAKNMLVRINFPREALILAKMSEVGFNFGIKLVLILALFIFYQLPVTWSLLLAPVALIHLILLGIAIGILLAPLGALYDDVSKALTFLLSFWLLLTPVIYPVPKAGIIQKLVALNPVAPLLTTTRELLTTGVLSDPAGFWIASGLTWLLLLIGWLYYRLAMPYVVERIGS